MPKLILASASTSRRRLLESAGLTPIVMVSHVDEETEFFNALSPTDMVIALAITKAHTILEQIDFPAVIIGCDSTFEFDGQSLGKPGTPEIAFERAKRVQGNSGLLHTGHCLIDTVKELIHQAETSGVKLLLPTDIVVAPTFAADATPTLVSADNIPADQMGLDIGPETARAFADAIKGCKTVFWNGPMGVFEFPNFAAGTKVVAQALTEVSGISVVGGGDSAAAVRALGFADSAFGYISTGGGASLEYLEGKELPGLKALDL